MGQSVQEWTMLKFWKTAFEKFDWLGTFLDTLPQMQGHLHDSLVWISLVCAKVIHDVNRFISTSFWKGLLGARALRYCKSGQAIRDLVGMSTDDIFITVHTFWYF